MLTLPTSVRRVNVPGSKGISRRRSATTVDTVHTHPLWREILTGHQWTAELGLLGCGGAGLIHLLMRLLLLLRLWGRRRVSVECALLLLLKKHHLLVLICCF